MCHKSQLKVWFSWNLWINLYLLVIVYFPNLDIELILFKFGSDTAILRLARSYLSPLQIEYREETWMKLVSDNKKMT